MPSVSSNIDPTTLLLELDGYQYPLEYRWIRLLGLRDMTPWHCIDDIDQITTIRKEFLREVSGGSIPVLDFLPFARVQHTDDFAGFVQSNGKVTGQVCVTHLTFRGSAEVSDYPTHVIYPSMWEWLTMVLAATREWCKPAAVAELESRLRRAAAAA